MSLPYETSTAKNALGELQAILAKFGCKSYGSFVDDERGATIVQFKWRNRTVSLEASWKGYATGWTALDASAMPSSRRSRKR